MKKKPPKHRSLPAHSLQDPKFRQRVKMDKREKKLLQAITKTIKDFGLENFKRTSLFISAHSINQE